MAALRSSTPSQHIRTAGAAAAAGAGAGGARHLRHPRHGASVHPSCVMVPVCAWVYIGRSVGRSNRNRKMDACVRARLNPMPLPTHKQPTITKQVHELSAASLDCARSFVFRGSKEYTPQRVQDLLGIVGPAQQQVEGWMSVSDPCFPLHWERRHPFLSSSVPSHPPLSVESAAGPCSRGEGRGACMQEQGRTRASWGGGRRPWGGFCAPWGTAGMWMYVFMSVCTCVWDGTENRREGGVVSVGRRTKTMKSNYSPLSLTPSLSLNSKQLRPGAHPGGFAARLMARPGAFSHTIVGLEGIRWHTHRTHVIPLAPSHPHQ